LIGWGCLTSPTFIYFCNEPIWLAHCNFFLKLLRLLKIKDYMKRWSASPISEKGRTLGKTYEIKAVLGGYHKYLRASPGYHLGILVWSPQGISTSDALTENRTFGSHMCDNRMWESGKVWPLTRVSGFNRCEKLVQAMRKNLWRSSASFSLLEGMMLSQAKERTLSSLNPHQNLHIRFNLPWEIGDTRKG
jgi:hypothetical protein